MAASSRPTFYLLLLLALIGLAGLTLWRSISPPAPDQPPESPAQDLAAPSLEQRLAKWERVQMPFDSAGLSERERQMVNKLVEACHYLDEIYWRQSDPEGLTLYQSLAQAKTPRGEQLRLLLLINGGRFDLLDGNRPFVGSEAMPPGHNLYPKGLTRDQIEQYVKLHPEKKAEIYSQFTVVVRRGEDLAGVPYHEAFKQWLEPMARVLREAAALSDDKAFARFLDLRAGALLTDDYYPSDLAWLDLKDPKVDLIFAPYETYLDDLLGVKGSYGASILVRNEAQSRKLSEYQKYVPDIQDALPLPPEDRPSKRGHQSPMEAMDAPFRAGDLRHGYQAVADNLPNDPRIHQEKGTKKIFFKNFMDARVDHVILPVAQRVMDSQQAAQASADGYLTFVMMHEICHGLGPAYAHPAGAPSKAGKPGGHVSINEAIGPVSSGLEEAKADVTGMFGLAWLMDHGALPKNRSEEFYASYVAGVFRSVRFGTAEAHGLAEMMEFNYLVQQKAVSLSSSGRYVIDYSRIPGAIASLAKELLEIEATGDRARAEAWFMRYDQMPAELKTALKAASSVPVDIDPVFSFPEGVQ